MEILYPSHQIERLDDGVEVCRFLERCGRTAYKSEPKITNESYKKFLKMILTRRHESVIEHASMSVRFICDRGVTHELVRHRLVSYTQESTRYCNYEGGVRFIIPFWATNLRPMTFNCEGRPDERWFEEHEEYTSGAWNWSEVVWLTAVMQDEQDYIELLKEGRTPQEARDVLPNCLKTEIVASANLREWRHIFRMRTPRDAHPQMRKMMIPLLEEVRTLIPGLFDDVGTTEF